MTDSTEPRSYFFPEHGYPGYLKLGLQQLCEWQAEQCRFCQRLAWSSTLVFEHDPGCPVTASSSPLARAQWMNGIADARSGTLDEHAVSDPYWVGAAFDARVQWTSLLNRPSLR